MSTLAIVTVLAVVAGLAGVHWLICRLRRAESTCDRIIREACDRVPVPSGDSYQGPDSLRLLEDLEAHMKAYGETVADLYDTTPGGSQ